MFDEKLLEELDGAENKKPDSFREALNKKDLDSAELRDIMLDCQF